MSYNFANTDQAMAKTNMSTTHEFSSRHLSFLFSLILLPPWFFLLSNPIHPRLHFRPFSPCAVMGAYELSHVLSPFNSSTKPTSSYPSRLLSANHCAPPLFDIVQLLSSDLVS
ncbi:hypothetical protein CIPAW_03G222900 [Carya illinoinensis]|uniref:Uncharacterized protein n=1 Tax=Carya illinoinensis TaxID=32201 RepID=A0A8T1R5V0_CARIL|nr:hypothetical protein CIPAW_03G222900 [Carya illinoinensis]